jgi:hypothetical protein
MYLSVLALSLSDAAQLPGEYSPPAVEGVVVQHVDLTWEKDQYIQRVVGKLREMPRSIKGLVHVFYASIEV